MSSPRALLEPYLAERALYVSESTVCGDLFHLNRFFEFLDELGLVHVGAISLETLKAYRHRLDTVPGKRGTLASGAFKHKALHVPRLFLLWAFREGHTLVDFSSFPLPHRTLPEIVVPPSSKRKGSWKHRTQPNRLVGGTDWFWSRSTLWGFVGLSLTG